MYPNTDLVLSLSVSLKMSLTQSCKGRGCQFIGNIAVDTIQGLRLKVSRMRTQIWLLVRLSFLMAWSVQCVCGPAPPAQLQVGIQSDTEDDTRTRWVQLLKLYVL